MLFAAMLSLLVLTLAMPFAAAETQKATGTANGFGGELTVEVTVDGKQIVSVEVLENKETPGVADPAINNLPGEIVAAQSVAVDVKAGCTLASNAVLEATKTALLSLGFTEEEITAKVEAQAPAAEEIVKTADVIVIGTGGAGMTAAYVAAKNGASVIAIDKMSYTGGNTLAAGSSMNAADPARQGQLTMEASELSVIKDMLALEPRCELMAQWQADVRKDIEAYPIFREMGIYEEMERNIEVNVQYIRQFGPGEEEVEFKAENGEWCIPRRIGDDIIRRAALRAGAEWLEGFDATELIMSKGQVKGVKGIYNNQDMTIEADLTVIANGSHSVLARQLGIFNNDPGLYMFAIRGYWENVKNLKPGTTCWVYDPEWMPVVDQALADEHFFQPIWVTSIDDTGTRASVGCCVCEGLLRAHGMSLDEYFNTWLERSKPGQLFLKGARCVDGMKGWRLPCCNEIGKNYAAGAMVIGDAASAPDPCYYYGVSPAMYGGKFCAEIAAEAFAENDFSEAKLSEFQKRLGEMYNPIWAQYAAIRKMIVGNREVARDLILTSRAKPEYPDIYYGACFSEYMAKVFHSDAKMSFGSQLADRD